MILAPTGLIAKAPRGLSTVVALIVVFIAGFVIGVFVQSEPGSAILGVGGSDAAFERRVEAYLANNPEVIVESFRGYAERQSRSDAISLAPGEKRGPVRSRVPKRIFGSAELLHDPDSPVGGNPDGDVSLVEFFDYNCPYCRAVLPTIKELAAVNPELRIVYKEFPILSESSSFAARAALASRKQGRYFEFHDALMSARGTLKPSQVFAIARSVGLSVGRLKRDMDDPTIQEAIERNLALARSLRVTGTPSFVIGDNVFRGAADGATLQSLIDRAR